MDHDHRADLTAVAGRFADPTEFGSSPLYRSLSRTVAESPRLLHLAARGKPGQHPAFLFFGAVQALLLAESDHPDHPDHPLAGFFPSIVGTAARPPSEAGP